MLRRVIQPMLLAVGVWVGVSLLGFVWSMADERAMGALIRHEPTWTLPVLPDRGWLMFVAVFVAVRLCASRGGSRRECVAVGLSPLAMATLGYGALMVFAIGLSALGPVVGFMGGVAQSQVSIDTALTARANAAHLLGLAGTCLAATWLYFRASAHPDRQAAAGVS